MEDLIGILIVAAIAIFVFVYVILPISVFLLVGTALTGAVAGAGVAAYNFGNLVIEAHKKVR